MREPRKTDFFKLSMILITVCVVASCSSTKFVPEGAYMLNKVDVKIDNKHIDKKELNAQLKQKENVRILGFWKFHLGLYNLSSKNKTAGFLKKMGEAPVMYDHDLSERSKEQLALFLQNKGYYNAVVEDTVFTNRRKPKRDVVFNISTGTPYRIKSYSYDIADKGIEPVLMRDTLRSLIKRNDIFDVDILNDERNRLVTMMKNFGYYGFSPDHIQFVADTNLNSRQADLTIEILGADPKQTGSVVRHKRFKVRQYNIYPDFIPFQGGRNRQATAKDTLVVPPYTFIYSDKLRYRPQLFDDLNRIKDRNYYSLRNVEKTYRSLNQINQFRMVNVNFNEVDSLGNDSIAVLDCNFNLTPLPRQGFTVEVEGTNSSGNLGVAGSFNYQKRNMFRGAEIFNITLRGAFERQQSVVNESRLNFNTFEYGIESSLTMPKFLNPLYERQIFNFQTPQTSFTAGYNYQRRPDYTRAITTFRLGYNWKTSQYRSHFFSPFDINYVHIYEFNPDFINSIKDMYIKSSYTDHLIVALNYTNVDNTQIIGRRTNYRYVRWSFESAGNLLQAVSSLVGKEKKTETDTVTGRTFSYHQILGTRFAQYLKGDFEYRYGHMIDKYNSVLFRGFLGVGVPYGNWDILPFVKKYFTGGANGIRAWQVRTLGPGTYKAAEDEYPNQSGDIKLEANLEYRYRLVGRLEGAFFLDAGNIWAINDKDDRPGAQFKFDRFYDEIALGTGTGFRLDFTYFIFRLDLGMKLRDPSLDEGKRFIIGNYPLRARHFNFSFAIGYPF